jgi:hypothetical protein
MRRAGHKWIASLRTTSATPPDSDAARGGVAVEIDAHDASSPPPKPIAANGTGYTTDRRRQLPAAIRQRIQSRLAGRVRNLAVRLLGDTVVLEGQCSTFYTKQLAQHAALGILEDEHLENAIVVVVPR